MTVASVVSKTANQIRVSNQIIHERDRQDMKWGYPTTQEEADALQGSHLFGRDQYRKLAILGEEVGEANKALLEGDHENFKTELVQIAAVCMAILESIEEYGR